MFEIFGVPSTALFGQLLLGLINGSFYALLSIGLAVIFGLLNIINFAHGAQYTAGAFLAWMLLNYLGVNYWAALVLVPLIMAVFAIVVERLLISRTYRMDHLYGLLLTFGIALLIEGGLRQAYGVSGLPYTIPKALAGGVNLGFMFLPWYRGWAVAVSLVLCLAVWVLIEKTRVGAMLRAATENPTVVRSFGINVPLLITLTYALGVALASVAGVIAAPIYQVSPMMGSNLVVVVFAVVVIGGMGSIMGAIVSGFGLGIIEGLTKVFYPEAANLAIFIIMVLVLLCKPAGLFGKPLQVQNVLAAEATREPVQLSRRGMRVAMAVLAVAALVAPWFIYPTFLMKVLCFALFAAAYATGIVMKLLSATPELGLLAGVLTGGLLGLAFGAVAIRRQGIYFAMITLALSQLVYFIAVQAGFTGGEDGLQSVPRGKLFGIFDLEGVMPMYYFTLAVFALGYAFVLRVLNSPFGEVIRSVRDNEQRARSLGYSTSRYKLMAFTLSASVAGLAGGLKVLVFGVASLTDVHWHANGEVVLMALLGGIGTVFGPLAGAFTFVSLQNYLAPLGSWVLIVQGAIFILCVLLFRDGIMGLVSRAWLALTRTKKES
ncbi:branched-chain amino acid ABC transporter permease [Achromobacter insolitus]|uniref:ABC transporter permease n=1 Tax=Achromobacter insolitus TaxID=217204 RepID=UPI0007C8386D|nr:ABC transporter permease [Achromobacter insolitus]OAE54389.1 branched-chain amino acid ABC transporter permease [Achromobacter insolitus]